MGVEIRNKGVGVDLLSEALQETLKRANVRKEGNGDKVIEFADWVRRSRHGNQDTCIRRGGSRALQMTAGTYHIRGQALEISSLASETAGNHSPTHVSSEHLPLRLRQFS